MKVVPKNLKHAFHEPDKFKRKINKKKAEKLMYSLMILMFLLQLAILCYKAYYFSIKPTYKQNIVAVPTDYEKNQHYQSEEKSGRFQQTIQVSWDVDEYSIQQKGKFNENCPKLKGKKLVQMKFTYDMELESKMFTYEQFRDKSSDLYLCLLREGKPCLDSSIRSKVTIFHSDEADEAYVNDIRKVNEINDIGLVLPLVFMVIYVALYLEVLIFVIKTDLLKHKTWADYHQDLFINKLNNIKTMLFIFFWCLQPNLIAVNGIIIVPHYDDECIKVEFQQDYFQTVVKLLWASLSAASLFFLIGVVMLLKNYWLLHWILPYCIVVFAILCLFGNLVYTIILYINTPSIFNVHWIELCLYSFIGASLIFQIIHYLIGILVKESK